LGPQAAWESGVDPPEGLQQTMALLPPTQVCVSRLQQPQVAQSASVLHAAAPVVLVVEAPGVVVVLPNVVELPASVVVGNGETAEPQHTGSPVSLQVRRQHLFRFRLQLRVARRRQADCRFVGQSARRGSAAAHAARCSRQSVRHCLHAFDAASASRDIVGTLASPMRSMRNSTFRMWRPYPHPVRSDKYPIRRTIAVLRR
jgi:hypothetical protein